MGDLVASLGLGKEEVTLLETIFICRASEIIPTLRIILLQPFFLSSSPTQPCFWPNIGHHCPGKALTCTMAKSTCKASTLASVLIHVNGIVLFLSNLSKVHLTRKQFDLFIFHTGLSLAYLLLFCLRQRRLS